MDDVMVEKTKDLMARLTICKAKIAKDRDELRELYEEAEGVLEACDRADEGLACAIDALSELL